MFFLLVTGGSGTNDNGDPYTVSGLNLSAAESILYRTNAVYLFPSAQYADWRTACINAAADLYGATSNEIAQVENAWYAVGIGAASSICSTPLSPTAFSIHSASDRLLWNGVPAAASYKLQYKEQSAPD